MALSPIRTLSVLTLLTAVSGSVVLTHQGSPTTSASTGTTGTPAQTGSTGITAEASQPGADVIARSDEERASRSQARTPLSALAGQAHRRGSSPATAEPIDIVAAATAEAQELRTDRADGITRVRAERAAAIERQKTEARRAAAEARRKAEAKAARERTARIAVRASRSARSDPRALARIMLADRGWSGQFGCLDSLWRKESGWNYQASNPSSGAYGIPQALPGSKMASAGSDWRTNPATQITWGLGYIKARYGNPCGAWSHSQSSGWY